MSSVKKTKAAKKAPGDAKKAPEAKTGAKPKGAAKAKSAGMTKAALVSALASASGVTNAAATAMLTALGTIAVQEMKGSTGKFTIPGLLQLKLVQVAAKPARMGRNPATGEPLQIKASPAKRSARARVLKPLKMAVL